MATSHRDLKTQQYFDGFTPHYDPKRFVFAIDHLNTINQGSVSLLDVGCGDGATLAMIKAETSITDLHGLDIAPSYLEKARESTGCATIEGSILDDALVATYANSFDVCTLGAVLHHLIGRSRSHSRQLAETCIRNCMTILKKEGRLIIFEPTYGPGLAMDAAFWIKKIVSSFSSNRIEVVKSWANFGEPVVSYYTPTDLERFIDANTQSKYLFNEAVDESTLGVFLKRKADTLVARNGTRTL